MELLFNKSGSDFSKEFKEALGFVDADFKFQKVAPDIRNATRAIAKEIGNTTYLELVDTYKAPVIDYSSTAGQLLQLAQNVIANNAYRSFAPSNDLQHGVNGRKMLTSNDSKTPFEHMLVASNDELDRRSFRAMDDLINLLDESSATWKASENYKASHRLFVRTTAEFDEFYTIESRFLLQKLSPGIALAEKRLILPRIGRSAFDLLKTQRQGTSTVPLHDDDKTLLLLINEACVYSALAWGVVRLQATLFPDGIYHSIRTSTIKGRAVPQGNQIDQLAQKFNADAAKALLDIEAHVKVPVPVGEIDKTIIPEEDHFGFSSDDKFVS